MLKRISLICEREYLVRVRKKSFILMTILTPLLITLLYGIIIYINLNKDLGESQKLVMVSDPNETFINRLENDNQIQFEYTKTQDTTGAKLFSDKKYYGLLSISYDNNKPTFRFISESGAGITFINSLEDKIEKIQKAEKLKLLQIDETIIDEINQTKVKINTIQLTGDGPKETEALAPAALAFAGSLLIYFFIFMYGVQVMRGVIEEKSNRIVEVLISSVKPFELMMGKIIGIVLVGITQLLIWVVLIIVLGSTISIILSDIVPASLDNVKNISSDQLPANGFIQSITQFNYLPLLVSFIFYFIGGYLLYAAIFAAVGSAVDNETDTQQFILPVTIPLILSMVLAQNIILSNPSGATAIWLSMFPLTSPIIMMCRIPFGVPLWQILLSGGLLIVGILFIVALAAKIYRTGILMYGKKASYKEIAKWLFYKS
jgi:ABC-2 type transport system permease protein